MAQTNGGHEVIRPFRVKPLSQFRRNNKGWLEKGVGLNNRPIVSVKKLEPLRNVHRQIGSKPKSTTPKLVNQEPSPRHESDPQIHCEKLTHRDSQKCQNSDVHKVTIFTSVEIALRTLRRRETYRTPLVCLEDVFRTLPSQLRAVDLTHVDKLMNHSQSNIQKQHQKSFETELKKRLQRKSPVEKVYKDSPMEGIAEGCPDLYCDTPVKQNSTPSGKEKPKGRKKVNGGRSPRSSPDKKSSKNKPDNDLAQDSDGIIEQNIKQVKGKKGKGSPLGKDKKPVEVVLMGDYTSKTPEKQIIKKKKPKVKIDYGTSETNSTSYTPSPDSSSKNSTLKLSLISTTTANEGREFHNSTNHNESAKSIASNTLSPEICESSNSSSGKEGKTTDSPSSLSPSPSKELGRRIRAPNVRYSDDILLLPLRSPRRSRSPKGSAEKDGTSGVWDENLVEEDSQEKVKKSSEAQTSQLYSLLTNKSQSSKSVVEKSPVTDSDQSGDRIQTKSVSQPNTAELPLTNGVADALETKSDKSSEKSKKKRKRKSDDVESCKSNPQSAEKTENNSTEKSKKIKSQKSGAVRVLQFDEGAEETNGTENKTEDMTEKSKVKGKGKKAATPKKPKKPSEKGKKTPAKSSVEESINQTASTSSVDDSRAESTNSPTTSDTVVGGNSSTSLDLFTLIAKVKDNMNSDKFPTFADEVLLKADDDDNNKDEWNEKSENDPKLDGEMDEKNPQSLEIVDDFFSADFLKVSPKRLSMSPSMEKPKLKESDVNEESSAKSTPAKSGTVMSNSKKKKKSTAEPADGDNVVVSTKESASTMQRKAMETVLKKDEHNEKVERSDGKMTEASNSSFDPSVPLTIDTQERRNIFDAIMTDYPSPNKTQEKRDSLEKHQEKSACDSLLSTDTKAQSDIKMVSPKTSENLSNPLQGEKSIIEKIQVKLGIPVEESPKTQKASESSRECVSPNKQSEIKCSTKSLPAKKTVPSLVIEKGKKHKSTKEASDFELVMDTVDEHQMVMEVDSAPPSPPDGGASFSRPVPKRSTQRVTKEPAPLSVLSAVETEVQDRMCAFTSSVLDEYLDTKTNRKVKLSRPVKLNDSEERLVEDSDDEMETTEMPEHYNEFSGMIEQCEPSFDEIDGVLFTSFANEEALNAHVKVEKKTKIGKNEGILLGMARMKNLRERQNQIRNSVHQKKDARLKALKEQYKINQSLQGMHLVLLKYQRVFKRELILEFMAKEQENPGSVAVKTPKKTSDITQIKGWKHKFGVDEESLEMKASQGKLHWRTEERLLRNHDPEKLKQMGLDLKKKRRKNLVFTIRKGMSKGDPGRMEKVELASHVEGEGSVDGEEMRQDGESSFGQELMEMGYEILDNEKQKLRDKKLREKNKKYLMMKLKLNNDDIDILKKLGGQRLRSMFKPESPKKFPPPPPPTPPPTEDGEREGTADNVPDSPSKKKRKRKKNYFCIITLNSSMANAALSALHPKFVVKKKKKAKAVKTIKQEPVDPEFDKQESGESPSETKTEDKTEEDREKDEEDEEEEGSQSKDLFDKMCDKPDDSAVLYNSGCRYGCICHLCKFSGGSPEAALHQTNAEKKCTKEYCRLGCICDDNAEKIAKQHCGKAECMITCTCDPVSRRRNSRSSSQGEKQPSGGNGEDSQPTSQEESFAKKSGKKNEVIPRRKSTYRLAKNLDAVSRKAMLVYEASEKYETQKARIRRSKDMSDINITTENKPNPSVSSGPQTGGVVSAGPVPQKRIELTMTSISTPGLTFSGPVTINIPQPKIRHQPIQREVHHKVEETVKLQPKKVEDDGGMALFDSDSDMEDFQEVISCARVDGSYSRGHRLKRCTCGKDHVQSRAVSSQYPNQCAGQTASSGLSVLQQRLTGKATVEAVWQTQWVCLKSNKPPTEKDGDAVKLLEILSNCNWEPHKQKILSRISRHIHSKTQSETWTQPEGYPQPCLIHIGEFEIEFLPKSSKPATIPPEVRNNMPSAIFSIRVRISLRDLNFPKLFKALPLDSKILNNNSSPAQPDKVAPPLSSSDGEVIKPSVSVAGISGFSHLQINRSIQKEGNSAADRSHLHPISSQQMTQMKSSQLITSIQSLASVHQNNPAKLGTHQTQTKAPPAIPVLSPSINMSSTSTTTSSLTTVLSTRIASVKVPETSNSVCTSVEQSTISSVQPPATMINVISSSPAPPLTVALISSDKPILSVPIPSKETANTPVEVSSTPGSILISSALPSQTHSTANSITVVSTSSVTLVTSFAAGKPVTSTGGDHRTITLIKQPLGPSGQSAVSKTTLVSLQSVLQNKIVTSSSQAVAKTLSVSASTPILPSSSTVSEIKVAGGSNSMQVHDLRPPASLNKSQVQEKVCVLGPKSSPVTLLGPFTSPSSIPKVLPQMKIVQSSLVDKDGKPVIHLVPFTGSKGGKPISMSTVLKSSPVVSAGAQQGGPVGLMKNPTNVYTVTDVSTTTTNVSHTSNASTTVTQCTVPAMSEKIQGPLLPRHGDQILLVSSDEKNIKLLNKLKMCDNRKVLCDNSNKVADVSNKLETSNKLPEGCNKAEASNRVADPPDQSHVEGVLKRKLESDDEEERKKVKISNTEDRKVADGNPMDSDSVLAKILLSDSVKETYSKYRDIKTDVVREDGVKTKREGTSSLNSSSDKENVKGSKEEELRPSGAEVVKADSENPDSKQESRDLTQDGKEKTGEGEYESDCGSPDNRPLQIAEDLDSSCDKSDESDATVVGGIDADQKDSEGESGGKLESRKSEEDQVGHGTQNAETENKDMPSDVIHIQDSPVKSVSGCKDKDDAIPSEHDKLSTESHNLGVNSVMSEPQGGVKRRLSCQDEVSVCGKKSRAEDSCCRRGEEKGEESEEDLCMTVEDTDDMAVIIPNEECVEIVNSSDEDIDIETEPDTSMNKLLRKQSDNTWEFFNPSCNVHCLHKKPHAKRKTNHQTNVYMDDFQFKEGFVGDKKTRRIQMKKAREKQRREEMRISFKALAESMYGEDKDDTKYSQILNHTEPKVQLLNKAREKIDQMEEVSRLMVSENQSTQARNTLLKCRLQSLKECIIKDRGMPWMVLQAHLDKIAKVCKKIFQNMPAILKKRALDSRAAAGSSGHVPGVNRPGGPFAMPSALSRSPASALPNGPVPIQMVSSEQVRFMAKNKEFARIRESTSNRADIYIDYAEEENEICEDLMRREERNRRKQNHDVNLNDDMSFEIGDLPSLFKRSDYLGSFSPQESRTGIRNQAQKSNVVINIPESEGEKVILADEYDDSGKMTVYRLNSTGPITKVPVLDSDGITEIPNSGDGVEPKTNHLSNESGHEDTPMLVITDVKSLSSDS